MSLVIRMKTVARVLIFTASLMVWLIIGVLLNENYLRYYDTAIILGGVTLALLQTWGIAAALHT